MAELSRHVRRIARRPYYAEARRLLEFVAPVDGVGVAELDRFLAELNDHNGMLRRAASTAGQPNGPRRRKRRRGGRRHRRRTFEEAADSITSVTGAVVSAAAGDKALDAPEGAEQLEAGASPAACADARER
jgi:hypothetical protein